MESQHGFYSKPPQFNNDYGYSNNGYPRPWQSDQPNLLAYHNCQATDYLPQSFHDALVLSPSGHIGALEQKPTLGSVPMERQSGMGSASDDLYAAFHRHRHLEDEVTISGQRSQQELGWELKAPPSEEEEDDSSSESGDNDDQDEDVDDINAIRTGHLQTLQKSWIPWEPYTKLIQLFDEKGNRVEVVVKATAAKQYGEETVNGHRHHVMYRRNYFKVEGQYWLTPTGKETGQLYIHHEGNLVPVEAVCATVRGAVDEDLSKEVEISTFNTTRTKLSRGPLTLPLTPSNADPVFVESTAANAPNELGTWLRMQWRKATENNGSRRSKRSSTYNIVVRFMARVRTRHPRRQQREAGSPPGTELVNIGYCMSGPIQARGRCPQSFEEYDPTNVDHKRRRPNNNKLRKELLDPKYDSKRRIGKAKRQDAKKTRQSQQRTILPRKLTPSTVHSCLSRSLTPTATQPTVDTSLPSAQAPTAPMMDFSAARIDVDRVLDDELDNFQAQILNEFGHAGENRYQIPAATPMWSSQNGPSSSDGNLVTGVAAWGHPDAISSWDFNFDLH